MKLSSTDKSLLHMARQAITNGKYTVASAYLNGLPDCYEVRSALQCLKSQASEKATYEAMSQDEKDAYDNK